MRRALLLGFILFFPAAEGARAGSYEVVEVENGGSIAGQVIYRGTPAPPEKLIITTDKEVCGKNEEYSRDLLVGSNGGIKNAVVHLDKIGKGKGWGAPEYLLGQGGCRFDPHVLLVTEGADLHILNTDRIPHSVQSYGRDSTFNIGQPKFVVQLLIPDFSKKLGDEKIARIGCAFHGWMRAYVVVQDHPYYAVTDENGVFLMADVPPGQYELKLWHETLGETRQKVTVERNGEATVTFEIGG